MKKVPVGASIAHAYEFLFGRFFQIIGTAWLPAALFGVFYFLLLKNLDGVLPVKPGDTAALISTIVLIGGSALVFILIHSVIAISLTQEALGVRKDLTLAHLVVGPRELRLFFGYLRYYLLFLVLYVALIAGSVGAIFAAHTFGAGLLPKYAVGGMPLVVIGAVVLTIVLAILFVLSMFRLYFLLAAVAAVEHRTRLSRAWALTHGSAWRVFIVILLTLIPTTIAAIAAFYYLAGPADFAALGKAMQAAKPGNQKILLDFYAAHAQGLSFVAAVLAVVNGALFAGASAHAYRVTSGHEDPELEDDAALVAPLLTPAEEPAHHEPPAHGHDNHHGHHEDHHHAEEEETGDDDHEDSRDDHGHGGHGDHGHHGHGEHGHSEHNDHSHGDDDDGEEDAHGGDDHHGHGDHQHGHHEEQGHHGHDDHGHDDHGHGDHGHGDHGHGDHGHHGGHHAANHGKDPHAEAA